MLMKTTVISSPSLAGTSGITLDSLRVSYHGDQDPPASRLHKTGNRPQHGGFPGTGRANQRQHFTHLPPYQRGLAMVVQNYALFPHMKVEDNVAFGLRAPWAAFAPAGRRRRCLPPSYEETARSSAPPSPARGSGKTTVLRAIAGFVQPAGGRILIGDTDVTHLPPGKAAGG
jgi:ABC-type branched-subunit amino acid transport system ATPase component